MQNKKIIIVSISTLLVGVLVGWLIFGRTTSEMDTHKHTSVEDETQIWTCSMHPQIRAEEPGACPICGMDLIPLTSNSSSNPYVLEMSEEAVALANIQTTIVGKSNSNGNPILLNGVLKADETKVASLVAHIPGRIEKLYVSFTGEKVIQGQKIASIYSPELITAQKELIEAKKLSDLSPSLLEAAKNKLKYWKIGAKVIDEILQTEKIQENFTIYAEHTGIVKAKKISVGDYISTGEVLFTVENLSQLWVLLDVYEKDLGGIGIGDPISFSTTAYPNKIFNSKIVFIDPSFNSTTRVATIRAEINNPKNLLKPEMFVKATLEKNVSAVSQIYIPKTSVLWTGERSVVYVKLPNISIPSFEYKEVILGKMIGSNYEIIEGITLGDEIVTNGAFVIDASAQLNNQASMMNKNVTVGKVTNEVVILDYKDETPKEFKIQLQNTLDNYFKLKDALVASDIKKTKTSAESLITSLSSIKMGNLKGDAHLYWMDQLKLIESSSILIAESNEIQVQRQNLEKLSLALIHSVNAFGVYNINVYVLHCPMANDGGSDWLSKEAKVLNPYFGDKMLKCGSVIETFNPLKN